MLLDAKSLASSSLIAPCSIHIQLSSQSSAVIRSDASLLMIQETNHDRYFEDRVRLEKNLVQPRKNRS